MTTGHCRHTAAERVPVVWVRVHSMCQPCHAEKGVTSTTPQTHMRYTSLLMGYMRSTEVKAILRNAHIHLSFVYMFNAYIPVANRTSDAVYQVLVNPVLGTALVEFRNGYCYKYSNVSRRAIINLIAQPNMSLGFWVNNNCVNAERTNTLSLQLV